MCVGFWSLTHPEYALILCANRDEFLARPTVPAHFHAFESTVPSAPPPPGPESDEDRRSLPHAPENARVLSGRDLVAGGTWLGLSRRGRLAFLTNITEPPPETPYPSSRGHLLESFLLEHSPVAPSSDSRSVADAAQSLVGTNAHTPYAGFNLLLFDAASPGAAHAALVTNGGGGGPLRHRALSVAERACGGLSNAAEDEDEERRAAPWPKVAQGTAVLDALLDALPAGASEEELAERLFALLALRSDPPPDPANPLDRRQSIAIPPRASAAYGTRASTVVLVSRSSAAASSSGGGGEGRKVYFAERPRWALGAGEVKEVGQAGERAFRFRLDGGGAPSAERAC
ncbi:NRDE protein-domain-containing protein [Amylostereum chailletii]|nr:NRDE protein-domain-containing protein [Amylostereum chailletii]